MDDNQFLQAVLPAAKGGLGVSSARLLALPAFLPSAVGAKDALANPFVRTAGQLMFAWSLVGIELETLTSHDKLKLGLKSLEIYQTLMQHVARDNSGLSLASRKDATCFLRWIMSVMTDSTILACQQRAIGSKAVERRVSAVILNVYQSTGIEKEEVPGSL